ncbi:G-D-S-L family lipolytic protein [candidate division KSB3 bacterium]|uniref:G-D-S-L family lipolytic protein n=1 Tax=candidate division KSB3 bacterium TaxID=2044937 RepID=A0A2G6K8C6_9BACT|nr:MAG: G-D-S-L family lipolytic protein [candidate division KSB3 bacterium]
MRDREHVVEKPPNTIRIAVLGDSYAEALQIPLETAFWKVMEHKLEEQPAFAGRRVEVINFGVSGDGTAQEFLTLQHYVWKYEPDIVLLALLTGNDIRNNSKKLESNLLRPFFVFQNDTLVLDNSFLESPVYKRKTAPVQSIYRMLSRHLRVLQLCNAVKRQAVAYRQKRKELLKGDEFGLDHLIYMPPHLPEWEEAWKITEAILMKMHREIVQHNARLLVVTLSNGIQVHPDSTIRMRFMETFKIDNIFYPDDRLKNFGKKTGIEVLTLAPMLQKYATTHQQPLHGFENATLGFGHWNEEGHRIAGEIIADYLCSN